MGEVNEAPPVAEEASEFQGSAPFAAGEGKRETAGATVRYINYESHSKHFG